MLHTYSLHDPTNRSRKIVHRLSMSDDLAGTRQRAGAKNTGTDTPAQPTATEARKGRTPAISRLGRLRLHLLQPGGAQVRVDLAEVVQEVALEVVPHLRLVLCNRASASRSRTHTKEREVEHGRKGVRTVQLPGALHRIVSKRQHEARLEHERCKKSSPTTVSPPSRRRRRHRHRSIERAHPSCPRAPSSAAAPPPSPP